MSRLFMGIATALSILLQAAPAEAAEGARACAGRAGRTAQVAEALDGGALRLAEGEETMLAHVLLPSRLDGAAGAAALAEEARALLARLTAGETVRLVAADREPDRYGRLPSHVVAGAGKGTWIQGALLTAGLARVSSFAEPAGCAKALLAMEAEARLARRGLWADPAYAVRDAGDIEALNRLIGRFAVIEGRILEAGTARDAIYLNFGQRWKEDFTVKIAGRTRNGIKAVLGDPLALKGRQVRVRGWVESENGPMIVLTRPEQIELIEDR